MLMNSTVNLSLSYSHGDNEIMVALYGPSDLKGFKQDPAKAVIDLSIRDTSSKEANLSAAYNLEALRSELRSILE